MIKSAKKARTIKNGGGGKNLLSAGVAGFANQIGIAGPGNQGKAEVALHLLQLLRDLVGVVIDTWA